MPNTIISDASCFIILEKIGQLNLLRFSYEHVYTTSVIAHEFGLPLPKWVILQDPRDNHRQIELQKKVDPGEASAIALAFEVEGSTLVIDDQKARKIAESLGIPVTGTIGLIVRAKLKGTIPSIRPLLESMRSTNFRFSEEVESEALQQAGE